MPVVLNENDLNKALAKLDAQLAPKESPSVEDFDSLAEDMVERDSMQTVRLGQLYTQLQHVRQALYALDSGQTTDRKRMLTLATELYNTIQRTRASEAEDEPSPYEGAARMAKSLAPTASRPVQMALARRVVEFFGPNGGQKVAYNRDLNVKLRFRKASSLDEEGRWKQFGLLPDRVDLANPAPMPAHLYADAQKQAQMMRGIGMTPLLAEHLLRQQGSR